MAVLLLIYLVGDELEALWCLDALMVVAAGYSCEMPCNMVGAWSSGREPGGSSAS